MAGQRGERFEDLGIPREVWEELTEEERESVEEFVRLVRELRRGGRSPWCKVENEIPW